MTFDQMDMKAQSIVEGRHIRNTIATIRYERWFALKENKFVRSPR